LAPQLSNSRIQTFHLIQRSPIREVVANFVW
jgi:hypothetical protein